MSLITLTHLQEAATYGQNYTAQVAADVVTAIEELVAEIDTLQSAIETLQSIIFDSDEPSSASANDIWISDT